MFVSFGLELRLKRGNMANIPGSLRILLGNLMELINAATLYV